MLWTKQFFYYDVDLVARRARRGRPAAASGRRRVRNDEWRHMFNGDIISMPDKWEYPWYAAWDLAFHMLPLAHGRPGLRQAAARPDAARTTTCIRTARCPAYEWNFGDVNPPVHAWATMQLFLIDKERRGDDGDIEFLKYAFSKLLLNFTWWVNRKDRTGAQRVRGRLPRARQHRRVRPLRAAAHGRLPGAGRRHGLDGALQPEHARDRARAGR